MLFYFFEILGAFCVLIGTILIAKPAILIKVNEIGNKVIFAEKTTLFYPRILGGALFLSSIYLIYYGW